MNELSVGGSGPEWSVFTRLDQNEHRVIVRSRANHGELRAFASSHPMVRLRCTPTDNSINSEGMPTNTAVLDEYEDALVAQLEQSKAEAYLVAVVTGAGCRDFFFAITHNEEINDAIKKIWRYRPFKLQVGWVRGPNDRLLASLAP